MQGISVPELLTNLDLAEIADIEQEEVAADFMPACVVGLSDGDLTVLHNTYIGQNAELYGETNYLEGKVAQTVLRAALDNGMEPGLIYDFQTFASEYFTMPKSPFNQERSASTVRIRPDVITVDDHPLVYPRRPQLVIDYAACLTGRSYISDQAGFLLRGIRPFSYTPLTRLHFTNQTLINTYDTTFGQGSVQAVIGNKLYIGREDGVAAATNEILSAQQSHGTRSDIADIVLVTGAQHSTRVDLKPGVERAHDLLREAGMLVIRSLAQPAEAEMGTEEIASWAYDAGFEESTAIKYEAALDKIGSLLVGGHFGDREIQTIILRK